MVKNSGTVHSKTLFCSFVLSDIYLWYRIQFSIKTLINFFRKKRNSFGKAIFVKMDVKSQNLSSMTHNLLALQEHYGELVQTGSPSVMCSALPIHWKSNRKLPFTFTVVLLNDVQDGTEVVINAGNYENISEIRNNKAVMKGGVAKFKDIRFVGKSGRGKQFTVTILIKSSPCQMATYCNAIKVTVDGQRQPRGKDLQ